MNCSSRTQPVSDRAEPAAATMRVDHQEADDRQLVPGRRMAEEVARRSAWPSVSVMRAGSERAPDGLAAALLVERRQIAARAPAAPRPSHGRRRSVARAAAAARRAARLRATAASPRLVQRAARPARRSSRGRPRAAGRRRAARRAGRGASCRPSSACRAHRGCCAGPGCSWRASASVSSTSQSSLTRPGRLGQARELGVEEAPRRTARCG